MAEVYITCMSPRNHADCVGNYYDAVLTGEIIIAGRYVQLAVERHLDDLEHAHQRGLHFDAEIAGKSLRFVEAVCTHQKAEWAGQPFLLSPNQQFILWNLIGWRRADGCRRFRRAYITAGRSLPQPAGTIRADAEVKTRARFE